MNHAWTTIALRALCAAPPPAKRARPVLQLFNGFARQQTARSIASRSQSSALDIFFAQPGPKAETSRQWAKLERRAFSASAISSAGKAKRSKAAPQSASKSLLEPLSAPSSRLRSPPTTVSHTEGLPVAEEDSSQGENQDRLTWRDYDPAGGMPLPDGELTEAEIRDVFGVDNAGVETGNYILSVVHWRRMSGALIDVGLDFPVDSGVSREQALQGLQYLRRTMPSVDEQANGQVWAEEEAHRLQESILQRATKLGIYKAEADDPPADEEELQGTQYGRERSGESVLEARRASNEAQHEREQAAKQAAEARAEVAALHSLRGPLQLAAGVQPETTHLQHMPSGGISIQPPKTKAWLQPVERKPWVKYYEEQATIIKSQSVPVLSAAQRLAPSFLVLLLVLAAAAYLSENYTPPPKSARLWPDVAPSAATLWALTGLLCTTFVLGRLPPLWRTFSKYLTLVPAYPYAAALVGAGLRHDAVLHLASNLVSLWLFGLLLHEDVGRGTFLAIYVASGAVGGFASLAYNVARKQWMAYIFGSSGCVLGVAAAACALRPTATIQAFGYDVPIAAWVFLALFTAGEAFAAARGLKTTIDHAGHLGGIFAGAAAAAYLRMRAGREREAVSTEELGDALAPMEKEVPATAT